MTSVVAWLALALAFGHWIYTLYWGFWLGARVKEIKEEEAPAPKEAPTPAVLELRRQTVEKLAGPEDGWHDNRCARCGHSQVGHHAGSGRCYDCPPKRSCIGFLPRGLMP